MTHRCTHILEFGPMMVTKRFRSWNKDEPQREWRTLRLLHTHAPGLAPMPVRADLNLTPPSLVMSRLNAVPLPAPLTSRQLASLAEAISTAHRVVPAVDVAALPLRLWHPAETLARIRADCARPLPQDLDRQVGQAITAAASWAADPRLDTLAAPLERPVLGHGDGNLANFLRDADDRVHLVDFEDSGRSDPCYELADLIEHLSSWMVGALDVTTLLEHFDLTTEEIARLRHFRRMLATWWLLTLLPDRPHHASNPPGTLERQAARLLALLA
ncbi:aminoglycoside phosphotransferase family protein [Sphaerisporangium album]|uniref:Aminoglycoside phosphotransferase family protein n=1 Tax=Sphaerisporangium album TaxID=509200 RepID=A0A367EJW1_9ACTN|nr:aminoglycoside phosphotransferase family protein [Sphaerisporangium album]RCG17915.1 aminoglycoside phosphotransferase family protein [Sphaerisporangium album]